MECYPESNILTLPQASFREGGLWKVSHSARIGFTGERVRGRKGRCFVIVVDGVSVIVSSVLSLPPIAVIFETLIRTQKQS